MEAMDAAFRSAVIVAQEQTEQHVADLISLKEQLEVFYFHTGSKLI